MKSIFTKISAIALGMTMALGVGAGIVAAQSVSDKNGARVDAASPVTVTKAFGTDLTDVSGSFDANISYSTIKNGASNPAYNASSQELRLYSVHASGNGNTLVFTPASGYTITDFSITASDASYTPAAKYSVDGGTANDISATGTVYSASSLSASQSLSIQNAHTGGSSNIQLRIKSITLTYVSSGAAEDPLTSVALTGDMTKKTYTVNDTWDTTGLVVTATYQSGATQVLSEGYSLLIDPEFPADAGIGTGLSVEIIASVGNIDSDVLTISGITVEAAPSTGGVKDGHKYFIVHEASNKVLKAGAFSVGNSKTYTATYDSASLSMTDAWIFEAGANPNTWSIRTSNNEYLAHNSANNGVKSTSGTPVIYELTPVDAADPTGLVYLQDKTQNRYLTYYSSGPDFRCYLSTTSQGADGAKMRLVEYHDVTSITAALNDPSATHFAGEDITPAHFSVTPYIDDTPLTPITDGTGVSVSPSTLVAGSNTITVTYRELTTTVIVVAEAPRVLQSVEVTGDLLKKSYFTGDEWDLSGLYITGHYSNSTTQVLGGLQELVELGQADFTLTPAVPTVDQGLTISDIIFMSLPSTELFDASDVTITGIMVNELAVSSLSVSANKDITFQDGDSFDISFLSSVTATLNSGITETLIDKGVIQPSLKGTVSFVRVDASDNVLGTIAIGDTVTRAMNGNGLKVKYTIDESSVEKKVAGKAFIVTYSAEQTRLHEIGSGEPTWSKVVSAQADYSGTYAIAYDNGEGTALVWTGVDSASCSQSLSITDGVIDAPTVSVTIASYNSGYSIKINGGTNNGKFISGTSGSNTINFNATESECTITFNEETGLFEIVSNTSKFVFNTTSGQERFRFYKAATASGASYKAPSLFKLSGSSIVEVDDNTIDACVEAYNFLYDNGEESICRDGYTITNADWANVKAIFVDKGVDMSKLRNIEADELSELYVVRFLGKYDSIVARFGMENFLNRNILSARTTSILNSVSPTGTVSIITIVTVVGLTSIGALLVLRKKKEQ